MEQPSESKVLQRLLTGSAMSMVNMCLAIIVGLLLSPYVIRTLGDRLFGMWALVGTLTGWYGLLDLGISGAVSRYITVSFSKGDKEGVNSYASIGFIIFTCVGFAGTVCAIFVSFFLRWLYPEMEDLGLMRLVIIILGVNFAIDFPLRVFSGIIGGCLRSDLSGARNIVFRIISAFSTFLALYLGGRLVTLSLTATGVALANAVSFYILARYVFPELRLSPKSVHREHIKPLFSYSFFTGFTQIMDLLKYRANNIFVAAFITLEMVTYYTVFTTLSSYGVQLINCLIGWFTTWFTRLDAQGQHEDIKSHFKFATKISVYLGSFVTFGLIFWTTPFVTRWVDAKYLEIYDAFLLLRFPVILVLWTAISVKYLYATAKHYYYSILTIIDSGIYLLILFLLIQDYGIMGIAIASSVATGITRIVLLPIVICRLQGLSYVTYWRNILQWFLISTICFIVPYFISLRLVVPEYKWLVLNGIICATLYGVSICFLGFSKEERGKIIAKIRNK